jgi:NAD(P)-dependent dehydrogenase (short-subunit alcohol dehydrogenase family)
MADSETGFVIKGASALVTGGSRGLGKALGNALAAAGARVVLVAREAGPLRQAVSEIRERGGEAHAVVGDVADKEAVHAIAGKAAALVGNVELLINNASTLGAVPLRLLLDTDCEDLLQALQVNLVGPFRLTKALAGPMVLRGHGTVVNISSDASVEPYQRWGAYGASKAALDHLGRIWAAELEGTGVSMLTIDPGEMNTRMHAEAMPEADPALLADPARVAARIVALLQAGSARSGTRLSIGSDQQQDARGTP